MSQILTEGATVVGFAVMGERFATASSDVLDAKPSRRPTPEAA